MELGARGGRVACAWQQACEGGLASRQNKVIGYSSCCLPLWMRAYSLAACIRASRELDSCRQAAPVGGHQQQHNKPVSERAGDTRAAICLSSLI